MTSVLIVEDHPLFVQSLTRLLRSRGHYDVTAVGSAEQALESVPASTFDIALIDVSLPGKSGIELLEDLRQRHPALPCLMVSGHTGAHYVNQSMSAGARGYVLKEDINGILGAVEEILQGGTYLSHALRPK